MATSQNGYPAFANYGAAGLTSNPTVPGTDVKIYGGLRSGAVLVVLLYAAARFHQEVQRLEQAKGCWGYNYRLIRGSETALSNHSSGTAWDLMAVLFPLGAKRMTVAQLAALQRISNDCGGVLRFGAFYSGRVDEMHCEINRALAQVEALAARIQRGELPNVPRELLTVQGNPGGQVGGSVTPPPIVVAPPAQPAIPPFPLAPLGAGYYYGPLDGPRESISGMGPNDARWVPGLKAAQVRLMMHIPGCLSQFGADGKFGKTAGGETYNAVRSFQAFSQRGLTVDGLIGPATWRELHR